MREFVEVSSVSGKFKYKMALRRHRDSLRMYLSGDKKKRVEITSICDALGTKITLYKKGNQP